MKRLSILIVATAVIAIAATGLANAKAHRARLQIRSTSVGKILVDGSGFTVYAFSKDRRNTDACVKIAGCISVWPAVTTSGKAIAGPGVKSSLIGTITLRGGTHQVTYAGHPLYTYVADVQKAQTTYVNIFQFKGFWPAVNAAGQEVK